MDWGKKHIGKLLFVLIAAGLSVASFHKGKKVDFETQLLLYDALRNTSGIVFAVMGAWIAIIYPEVVKDIESLKQSGHRIFEAVRT